MLEPRAPAEEVLVRALAGGDRSAAERLVELTYRGIYRALYRLTGGDPELAADLTQETYRRVWSALGSFEGRSAFGTWAYRVAYTTFLNHLRRPRPLQPWSEEQAAVACDPRPDPEQTAREHHEGARLRRSVLALPDDLRFTVTAHFWGELPIPEIARQEGVSAVAIRKRLRRAYALLQHALGKDLP